MVKERPEEDESTEARGNTTVDASDGVTEAEALAEVSVDDSLRNKSVSMLMTEIRHNITEATIIQKEEPDSEPVEIGSGSDGRRNNHDHSSEAKQAMLA